MTKAVAWVMEVGLQQWVARCRDMASDPLPLAQAKKAAKRMVLSGQPPGPRGHRVRGSVTLAKRCGIEVPTTIDITDEELRDIIRLAREQGSALLKP